MHHDRILRSIIEILFPYCFINLLSTEYPARMPGQVKQCEELMMGEGNELVIVVNSLFIDAYFKTSITSSK